MADAHEKWNNDEIASHLKSAVEALTPNVLDRIDLDTPQLRYIEQPKRLKVYRKMRRAVTAAAACLCVAALYGGVEVPRNNRFGSYRRRCDALSEYTGGFGYRAGCKSKH